MNDREKVIGLLQETAEYFRECRSNASFASKAENHFWELQNAANEAVELLKEQEAVTPILKREGRNKHYNDYVCPCCDNEVVYEQNYCSECGIPFVWEAADSELK